MVAREYSVAGRTYRFDFYGMRVGVCVKCYHEPAPRSAEAKAAWAGLSKSVQDKLREYAWSNVQEWWWTNLREIPEVPANAHAAGRSGGYVVFPDLTDSFLLELVDDVERNPCQACGGSVMLREHLAAESMYSAHQLPLPIPYAPWDIECAHCSAYYEEHLSTRCPMHLGQYYEPHRFKSEELERLDAIEAMVDAVAAAAEETELADALDNELDVQITWYVDNREDTDT